MKDMRNIVAGTLLSVGTLAAAGLWSASAGAGAADDAASMAPAAPAPGPHGPGGNGWGPERFYARLGLTADQQASLKAIVTAARPQMKSLHEQQRANSLRLQQTKPDDPNYANAVAEAARTQSALESQRITQRAELRAQMYALLTPAQKTQLAALEAEWQANPRHGHRGPHAPGADGPPPAP